MSENSLRSVLYRRVEHSIVQADGKDWPPILRDSKCPTEFIDKIVNALNRAALAATQEPPLFISAVSGLLYENPAAAGDIAAIRINGKDYALASSEVGAPAASGRETVATAFIRPINEGFTPGCISGCSTGTDGKFHHHPYCETYGHKAVLEIAGKKWVDETRYNGALIGIDPEQAAAPRPDLAQALMAKVRQQVIDEAISVQCQWCELTTPRRVEANGYISNFGPVMVGQWVHDAAKEMDYETKWCEAGCLWTWSVAEAKETK